MKAKSKKKKSSKKWESKYKLLFWNKEDLETCKRIEKCIDTIIVEATEKIKNLDSYEGCGIGDSITDERICSVFFEKLHFGTKP